MPARRKSKAKGQKQVLKGPQVRIPHDDSTVTPEGVSPEVMPFEGVERKYGSPRGRRNFDVEDETDIPIFDQGTHANYGQPLVSAKGEDEEDLEAVREAREALESLTETQEPDEDQEGYLSPQSR